jgi:hypothetical protein
MTDNRNGAEEIRTPDLRAASAALYQLSYSPTILYCFIIADPRPGIR